MNDQIVVRRISPIVAITLAGALLTTLAWVFYDYPVGVPVLALSLFFAGCAARMAWVIDGQGVHARGFLPFVAATAIPWAKLQSVDVDEVVTGVSESRRTVVRVRFCAENSVQMEIMELDRRSVDKLVGGVRARGVQVTDSRAPA